jgi:hypothetical protein
MEFKIGGYARVKERWDTVTVGKIYKIVAMDMIEDYSRRHYLRVINDNGNLWWICTQAFYQPSEYTNEEEI